MNFVTTQRACRYGCNKALPMSARRSKLQDEPNITRMCIFDQESIPKANLVPMQRNQRERLTQCCNTNPELPTGSIL